MPLSHICPSCLTELGRVRATPDPHYGLPVVVCPGCERATVRVRHPDRAYWRQMRHLRLSVQRLFLAVLFTALSVGAVIGMSVWVRDEFTTRFVRYTMPDTTNPGVVAKLMVTVLIVLMCGCLARTLYAHKGFFTVLAVYVFLVAGFAYMDAGMSWAMIAVQNAVGADTGIKTLSGHELKRRGLALLPALPLFIAGMAIGSILNGAIARSERKRVSRIRHRLRRRRTRQD